MQKNLPENRNIIFLLLSSFLSGIGNYIFDIGIIIYLYDETASAAIISGFFISQLLPAFIILFTGITIDKLNRKYLVIFCRLVRILLFILLLLSKKIIVIYFVSFMLNLIFEFDNSVLNAMLPNMFAKERLIKVSSITNIISSVSMVCGPLNVYLNQLFL
ncbi:MAG: MFS transporter [Clostridiaceae bacterium]|nr:MFS transporter [Clostridiaceae bacterium]